MIDLMPADFVTTAYRKDGVFAVRNKERFAEWTKQQNDGEFILTVRRATATRSAAANAWYWGVIVEMLYARLKMKDSGHSPDDLHDILKARFLPKRLALSDDNGEIIGEWVIGGTTTRLSPGDFTSYCDDIRQWAAETFSLDIPDPIDKLGKRTGKASAA